MVERLVEFGQKQAKIKSRVSQNKHKTKSTY